MLQVLCDTSALTVPPVFGFRFIRAIQAPVTRVKNRAACRQTGSMQVRRCFGGDCLGRSGSRECTDTEADWGELAWPRWHRAVLIRPTTEREKTPQEGSAGHVERDPELEVKLGHMQGMGRERGGTVVRACCCCAVKSAQLLGVGFGVVEIKMHEQLLRTPVVGNVQQCSRP